MDLNKLYQRYPTKDACLNLLEESKWGKNPKCPYCGSIKYTAYKQDNRYHCNTCNTTYSVTVGTVFHKTKIDLQKWFFTISKFRANERLTVRALASMIQVNNNTANFMLMRLRTKKMNEFQNLNF